MPTDSAEGAVAELEIHPPRRLAVGRGNAFVLGGYCYHPGEATRRLQLQLGGARHPVERFRLPRQDVWERLGESDPARPRAFRSGFVAVVPVAPLHEPSLLELGLVLTLASGRELRIPVGEVRAEPRLRPPTEAATASFPGSPGPRVAICLASYEPPGELLRRQLDSIRAQTHGNWLCLISDDASGPEAFERLSQQVAGDSRFVLSRSPERLGFYGNFERAMSMAPPDAEFVTLCDQDDSWHPDKLARLLDAIGDAQLAYSDASVVNEDGRLLQASYWSERRNNHTNLASLLLANSVTGAASLFRRELLDDVLPFPPELADPFHDHWLAVVALALGRIAYVEDPLYDYVQHVDAVIGHSQANKRPRPARQHLLERLRNPGDGSRRAYYYNWQQQQLACEVLALRCRERMVPDKRRALDRVHGADGVTGLAWLLARRARKLWGRNETLDRELFYAYAIGRNRAVTMLSAGRSRPGRLLPRDASIPAPPPSRYGGGG